MIIIHPTTNNSYTDWGIDRFIELASQLIHDQGHQVLACFPEKEKEVSKLLIKKLKGIYIHVGSLRQNMALISKSDLMNKHVGALGGATLPLPHCQPFSFSLFPFSLELGCHFW